MIVQGKLIFFHYEDFKIHTTTNHLIDILHGLNFLFSELALVTLAAALALQESLAILIELELGDDNLGGIDANGNRHSICLFTGESLDVDDPFLAVHSGDLALAALEATTDHLDLIVLADGDGADLRGKGKRRKKMCQG